MKELDLKLGTQQGGAVNEELQCKNERLEAIESSPSININFPNFAVHDPEIIHKSAAVPQKLGYVGEQAFPCISTDVTQLCYHLGTEVLSGENNMDSTNTPSTADEDVTSCDTSILSSFTILSA